MANSNTDLLSFVLEHDFSIQFSASSVVVGLFTFVVLLFLAVRLFGFFGAGRSFDIEEAEIGLGDQKITLRPNDVDRQIAYKIWIELSTRKIGLPIDLEDDVITEIYDSWYAFFGITRELIKEVPVSKFRRKDTEKIIRLSMDVLNSGVRPHLTKWQARFRRWYEHEINNAEKISVAPQEVQTEFPMFDDLKDDMLTVNAALMNYRSNMYKILSGKK